MKTVIRITCAVLVAGTVFAFFAQRRALNEARAGRQRLEADAETAARLARENRDINRLRQENQEMEGLRVANRDLYKLRNEVHQLREQAKELAGVRAENERLRAAGDRRAPDGTPSAEARPWLAADEINFAGYGTPEATLQTLFWAAKQGDVESVKKCLTPEAQKKMAEQSPDELRGDMKRMFERFKGVRVAARNVISAEEIRLGVQINLADHETPDETAIPFKLIAGEWRMDGGM